MFCFSFQTRVISNYLPVSISYRQCLFAYPYPFYLLSPFPLTSSGLREERSEMNRWCQNERTRILVKFDSPNICCPLAAVPFLRLPLFSHLSLPTPSRAFYSTISKVKLFCRPVLFHCALCSVGALKSRPDLLNLLVIKYCLSMFPSLQPTFVTLSLWFFFFCAWVYIYQQMNTSLLHISIEDSILQKTYQYM